MSTNTLFASREELIGRPNMQRPHVVILGAGASVASSPGGDKNGRRLPTMDNLVETIGLDHLLARSAIEYAGENFEALYSSMYSDASRSGLVQEIETAVCEYFSSLELPDRPTVYDHLLLSLRKKDAVFTFNWDPFLFDAWVRNRRFDLPEIFFLHGNVRAAYCPSHRHQWGAPWAQCSECNARLVPTRWLYPIKNKNYENNSFIASQWKNAEWFLANAFTLTIFGYGAPESDVAAIKLMETAWHRVSQREIERVEIIDIKTRTDLSEVWKRFIRHHHADYPTCFYRSRAADYPRRSCEALHAPTVHGRPAETFPIPTHMGFGELYEWINQIALHEGERAVR